MAANEGFRQEGSKVDHDLSQKWADSAKSHLGGKLISIGPFGFTAALSYSNVVNDIHLQLLCEHCLSTGSWYGQRSLVDKRFDVELVRPWL